jgi:hypothetical protein
MGTMADAYFERLDHSAFRATMAVQGAWSLEEQHIAPVLGLITHVIEHDRDERRGDELQLGRISFDILGVIPIDEVDIRVRLLRPGRTIELVDATLSHGGRAAVIARAWLLQPADTRAIAGSEFPPMPARDELPPWRAGELWPGEFVRTVDIRRRQSAPGRAQSWLRPMVPLLADEAIGPVTRLLGVADIANGLTPRITPQQAAFPNVDLTAHFVRRPAGEWIGFDTTMTVGPTGLGLTHTIIHDDEGPVGTIEQALTVRPRD